MSNKQDKKLLLTDEEIEATGGKAERLLWTYKAHPRFEKEKLLLEAQLKKIVKKIEANSWDGEADSVTGHHPVRALDPDFWQALLKEVRYGN